MSTEVPSPVEELPPPTAHGVLMRVWVTAFVATAHLPKKKRAKAFLRVAAAILKDEDSISRVSPIRPHSAHAAVQHERRLAIALFKLQKPGYVAALPRKLSEDRRKKRKGKRRSN